MKIALLTPDLPHYRRNLYKVFSSLSSARVVHYSDPREHDLIQAVDPAELREFHRVHNVKIGPLWWQKGVLKVALDSTIDCYLFTGDVKILSTWFAAGIVKLRRKPVYMWTIGWHRPEAGLKRLTRLAFYGIADKLLVYGDVGRRIGEQLGFPRDRMQVVYNSVTGLDEVDAEAIAYAEKDRTVGAIIRLNAVKRLDLLLEAAHVLKERGRPVKVILGGDGPERHSLELQAKDLGIECEFLGPIHDPAKIEAVYRNIRVTVVPSAAGLTAIQSMAHGVPVVTDDDDYGQMPEASSVIPGVTGSRFLAGDPESLADEIETWVMRTSENAREIAHDCVHEVQERWTPTAQARNMLSAIGAPSAEELGRSAAAVAD